MSFRCRSFLPHQVVVDILVVGISEGLVRHPVIEHIGDALNRLASCLIVVEEAMDVGVTVKVILTMGILTFSPQAFRVPRSVDTVCTCTPYTSLPCFKARRGYYNLKSATALIR